jgi:D-alanine transaminase
MLSYFNGKYLEKDEIQISPDDRGFLFADGLYELIRSYSGRLFRMKDHVERLNYGAREIRLPVTDFGYLEEVARELIKRNKLFEGDAIVYIQVTRGTHPRLHKFPPPDTPLTVYATCKPFEPKTDELEKGVRVIFVPDLRWARTDIKSVGLLPNVLAQNQAVESGASEAVLVRDGSVTEGTHSNFFAVIDGTVTTRPRTNYILGGITRQVILELCQKLSIPYLERSIPEAQALAADELFIAGTTVEITPVVAVDERKIAGGKPGPITKKLQEAFRQLT